MKKILLISCFAIMANMMPAYSQNYLYETGVGAGMSSDYGDLNQNRFFYDPEMAFSAHLRYLYNVRWFFSAEFLSAGFSGDSSDFDNQFPGQSHYQYDSRLWQLGVNAEFNFLNYGIGADYRNLSRFSPFITVGAALGFVDASQNVFSFSIPMGIGIRYKLAPRWGMALKMTFAKMLTDKADAIKDPYGIGSSKIKNTDWYSACEMSISYSFGERKRNCNNID